MSLYYNIDKYQKENFSRLASHTSVWSTKEPFTVSGVINLPKPIYSTLYNFLKLGKREEKVVQ